jgi:hypothetical protein
MTAKQLSAPLPGDVVTRETSPCTHQSITPGLDRVQCKNCHREWPCWHPDYERLLNQLSIVAPSQTDIVLEQEKSVLEQEKSVLEQKECAPVAVESAPEQKHWVEAYSPSNRKGYSYYRYLWMEGRKIRHVHIPGGNTKRPLTLIRKQEIERAITAGWWPIEIEELIKSWRHK